VTSDIQKGGEKQDRWMSYTWLRKCREQLWFYRKWWRAVIDKTTSALLVLETRKCRSWRVVYWSRESGSVLCRDDS